MVDPADSKSAVRKDVRVRLSPRALKKGEVQTLFSYDGITKARRRKWYIEVKLLVLLYMVGSSSWSRTSDFHSGNHGFESRTHYYKYFIHNKVITQWQA